MIASVCRERTKHRSSTISAVLGNSLLTHAPLVPCWENLNSGVVTGFAFGRWSVTIEKSFVRVRRLYEQGASSGCIGDSIRRWWRWVVSGLKEFVFCDGGTIRFLASWSPGCQIVRRPHRASAAARLNPSPQRTNERRATMMAARPLKFLAACPVPQTGTDVCRRRLL